MRRVLKIIPLLLACVLLASGCDLVQSLIHDDEVIAKVGKHKLYRSELNGILPQGISSADSTNLTLQYINSWAEEQLYCDMAMAQLSKAERDVSAELEAYRRTLLRYRYEQRFINDRLDTLVTETQMMDFYEANQNLFVLERPILKFRYIDIYKTAGMKDKLIAKMSSNKAKDVMEMDSLAREHAIRYIDSSTTWVDAIDLAREFGIDYGTMLSLMNQSHIVLESKDAADIKVAYIREIRRSGVAPLEFCTERIREYILSGRKRELLIALEQSLLQQASDKGDFVIY